MVNEPRSQDIQALLRSYFTDAKLNDEALGKEQIGACTILSRPDQFLSYLQTVFFEEHLLELQFDQSPRVFITNIIDDSSDVVGGEKNEDGSGSEYEIGSYLKAADSFLLAPLTPGIGNVHIRSCKLVVVRFYMGSTAVELGCTFRGQDIVGGVPVLRFDFPEIGRVNRIYRIFRVKVVSGIDAQICILRPTSGDNPEIYLLEDISPLGLAFQVPTKKKNFEVGENVRFKVQLAGTSDLEISGMVRRIFNGRDAKGCKDIVGVQFDLETRSLAAKIEQLTAMIQRQQLRKISEKIADMRGVRLIK